MAGLRRSIIKALSPITMLISLVIATLQTGSASVVRDNADFLAGDHRLNSLIGELSSCGEFDQCFNEQSIKVSASHSDLELVPLPGPGARQPQQSVDLGECRYTNELQGMPLRQPQQAYIEVDGLELRAPSGQLGVQPPQANLGAPHLQRNLPVQK